MQFAGFKENGPTMFEECTPHFQADKTMMTTKGEINDDLLDGMDMYSAPSPTDMRDDLQQYSSLRHQLQSLPWKDHSDPKTHKRWPGLQSVTKKKIDHSVGYHSLSYSSGGDTKLNDSNHQISLQSGGTIALSCSNSNQYSSLVTGSSSLHKNLIGSGAIPKVRSQAANFNGQARNLDGQARRTNGYQPQSGRHSLQTDSATLGINLSTQGSESTGLINSGSETAINGQQGTETKSKPQILSNVKGAQRTTANQENEVTKSPGLENVV